MPSPKNRNRISSTSQYSATGAAIRRGDLKISDPIPFDQPFANTPSPPGLGRVATLRLPDGTWTRKPSPPGMQQPRNVSIGQGEVNDISRQSAGPSLVPSSLSTEPSKGSLTLQKKNSGLRATLRRMFGSKRGRPSVSDRKNAHQSDIGNLTPIAERQTDARVGQHFSLGAASVTRASPLGSHDPTRDPDKLPRTSSERNRLRSPRRRRRNTVPSLILTDQEAQILAGSKDDLSAKLWKRAEPTEAQPKRRSRSADALNELVASYDRDSRAPRDRKAEIAYWRTSIIENPTPVYRGWPGPQAIEQQQSWESERDTVKLEPIQTFDFGLSNPDGENASLEERVNTLEIKLFDFEYAIAKLQGHDVPKPMLYHQPPKRRSIHKLFPDNGGKSPTASPFSEHELTCFLTSPDESPTPSTEQGTVRPDRSSKATTIRPLTARRRSDQRSNSHSPSPARIPSDQWDALMGMLKQEQSARRRLEAQLADLQRELEAMRTPVYPDIRPTAYPTPSPESVQETPLAQRVLHRSPRFGYQKTPAETSRFSISDLDTDTDDGDQDVYETPQEHKYNFESLKGLPLAGVS